MKNLTVGVLAHVDAGKTTLSEAILYRSGQLKTPGRVDHGDTFLDTDDILWRGLISRESRLKKTP